MSQVNAAGSAPSLNILANSAHPAIFAQTPMTTSTPAAGNIPPAFFGMSPSVINAVASMNTTEFLTAMQLRADRLMAIHRAMLAPPAPVGPFGQRQFLSSFTLAQPQPATAAALLEQSLALQQQLGYPTLAQLQALPFQKQEQLLKQQQQAFAVNPGTLPQDAMTILSALTTLSMAEAAQPGMAALNNRLALEAQAAVANKTYQRAADPRRKAEATDAHSLSTEVTATTVVGKKRVRLSRSEIESVMAKVSTPQQVGMPFQKASLGRFDKEVQYKFPHDPDATLGDEFKYFLLEYMKSIDSAQDELMTRRFDSRDDAEEALHFTLTHFAPCMCSVMYGTLRRKGGVFYRYLCPTATKRKHTQPGARGCPVGRVTDAGEECTETEADKLIYRPCSYTMNNPDAVLKAMTSRSQNDCHWVAILAACPDDPSKLYFKRIDSVSRHCPLCLARRCTRVKRVIMRKLGDLCNISIPEDEQKPPSKRSRVSEAHASDEESTSAESTSSSSSSCSSSSASSSASTSSASSASSPSCSSSASSPSCSSSAIGDEEHTANSAKEEEGHKEEEEAKVKLEHIKEDSLKESSKSS